MRDHAGAIKQKLGAAADLILSLIRFVRFLIKFQDLACDLEQYKDDAEYYRCTLHTLVILSFNFLLPTKP